MRWKKNFIPSKNNSIGPSLERSKWKSKEPIKLKRYIYFTPWSKSYPNSNFSLQFKYSIISISQFFGHIISMNSEENCLWKGVHI